MRAGAPAAAAARPDSRLAGARTPTEVRPRGLRLVPPVRRAAPKAPFVVLLGALLVGHHEAGRLVYAGKVGNGYTHRLLLELRARLDRLVRTTSPFEPEPPRAWTGPRRRWVQPELVAEIALAIEMGCEAADIGHTIHPHPTLTETVMESAEQFFGTATHVYKPKRK